MKLLSNLPIKDLTPENDYLGVIEKGDMIVSLLKSGNIEFEQMKMFALYGNWGSGKSTLMKYMQNKLDDEFKTFYFDAWQYENGKDLSFSLLEFMTDEGVGKGEEVSKDILKTAEKILIGTAKSISINLPGLRITPKELLEEIEKQPKVSFHREIANFKTEFKELEKSILAESKQEKKTNIVFIDDLDRCEPEKVLDLLSEIKLFFTYGERTIFFFGVDEKAVQAAIKTKYRDVVKSNEYLEKVFDYSFVIPVYSDLSKLLNGHFPLSVKCDVEGISNYNQLIDLFFSVLEFKNPRKIKKILNKYSLFLFTKFQKDSQIELAQKLCRNNQSPIILIYILYSMILFEFEKEEFDYLGINIEKKSDLKLIEKNNKQDSGNWSLSHFFTKHENDRGIIEMLRRVKMYYNSGLDESLPTASELLIYTCPKNVSFDSSKFLDNYRAYENIRLKKDSYANRFTLFMLNWMLYNYEIKDCENIFFSFDDLKTLAKKAL